MTEYSRQAKGFFTSTGGAQSIYLPFQPNYVTWQDYTVANAAPAASKLISGTWDMAMGQGINTIQAYNASSVMVADTVTANGTSSYGIFGGTNSGLMLQYGAQLQIASITKASPAVVTTAAAHGLATGQVVILEGLYQTSTTGMPQIATIPFVITVTGATTFTIPFNTTQSNYTALSGSPAGAYVRQVLYPWNYLPGVNTIAGIGLGTTTLVNCTSNHNFVVGQEVAFRIPAVYGTTQLNSLPNNTTPGSPVYGYVTSILSNTSFNVNINSTGYTTFNSNQPVSSVAGLSFPQVVAVGDVNTGGTPYSGGMLYPPPAFPTYSGGVNTINGPAISGAFVNNTAQGFTIGSGVGTNSSAVNVGTSGDVIYWAAYYFEYRNP